MKRILFSFALLIAASVPTFAANDESDPNPQPAPVMGVVETSCGTLVPDAPNPDDMKKLGLDGDKLIQDMAVRACGEGATGTWRPA